MATTPDDGDRMARSHATSRAPAVDGVALQAIGPFHLRNVRSGKCLTVQNASQANGALTLQFTCANDATPPHNDDWYLEDLNPNDPYYHIVNRHSGKCLTIQNAGTANNALARPVQRAMADRG